MNKSLMRYPGSKAKMLPILMEHLSPLIKGKFCDVFIGGGSVLLNVAEQYPKIELFCNDKDYTISSFWSIISSSINQVNELLGLMETKPTVELFYQIKEEQPTDQIRAAYKAIFLNRCAFSGIATSGPIGGKDQKSKYTVDCRYNFKKLKEKILYCHQLLSGRTQVTNKDFHDYNILKDKDITAYIDPPYFDKGSMLYPHSMNEQDHKDLSNILNQRDNWVLSYDDHQLIRDLYANHKIIDLAARYCINGKKSDWAKKNELIITP